jgi:hypothetical protein
MDVLMPLRESPPSVPSAGWPWRLLAAGLILGAAGLHVLYLASSGALDLAPDEAHYWDWSRHLDWSYYSKGPLVAYLIRAGCLLAGPWSRHLTGSAALAVRLPAVACGALLLAGLYALTVQVYRRERLACAVVAAALTLPLIAAGSSLMTIDAPYACCWGWALVLGHRAVFRGSRWAWPAAGLAVGLGILAKYTMVLWLPSVGLFLLTSRAHRRLLFRPGFWVMTATAAACCLPIVFWNVGHGWVTLFHVSRQSGVSGGPSLSWEGPFVYLGGQCALLLGFWFVAWLAAMTAHRPWAEADDGVRYLWWLSAPVFVVFLLFSVKTRGGEPNWPVTAYVSGLVLTAAWLARRLGSPGPIQRLTAAGLAAACGVGLALTLLIHRSDWAYPLLARLAGPATAAQPFPVRRFDPTCRLRGWRALAAAVDELRARLRGEGVEPVLACTGWALPGEVGFYCAGQPTVYSVGRVVGDRHSQYDLWRPNPVVDGALFRGRTFVVVGNFTPDFAAAFERVEPPCVVTHSEGGQPVASWTVTVCRGFRGFPLSEAPPTY